MAIATTYYDVVTRYRVDNLATSELRGYTNQTERAHRSTRRLHTASLGASRGFMMLRRTILPLTGGMAGIAGVGYAGAKTFRNLNTEMNSSIQLAGQLNLAFKFANDPTENFLKSMTLSRKVFRDLVKDAAALPGEASDFLGIQRMIQGPVFAAGGDTDQMRKLVGTLALATPATGGRFDEVGRGAMMMLQGRSISRNPLTAYMMSSKLLEGHDIASFHALSAAERLRVFSDGLSKLVDNPMFRKSVLNTFDTQLGTLADSLFGVEGALGRLSKDAFDGLLGFLTSLNVWFDNNGDRMVMVARALGVNSVGLAGMDREARLKFTGSYTEPGREKGWVDRLAGWWVRNRTEEEQSKLIHERALNKVRESMMEKEISARRANFLTSPGSWLGPDALPAPWGAMYRDLTASGKEDLSKSVAAFQKKLDEVDEGEARELEDPANVTQNFHIKLDVNTDESPEAVAVKIKRAMEVVGRDSSTTRRGANLVARSKALN